MRSIADARAEARRVYDRSGAGWAWSTVRGQPHARMPLMLGLAAPTETDAFDRIPQLREWTAAWRDFPGPGTVQFRARRWRHLGTQSLPVRLTFEVPADVAAFVGETARWRILVARLRELVTEWPELTTPDAATVRRVLAVPAADWSLLPAFLRWSAEQDLSQLLPRQIAFPGVDSKWFERHRVLLVALRRAGAGADSLLETRRIDARIVVRVLDPALRDTVGGLGDFAAPAAELARLTWQPAEVILSENKQSAYSFGDRPGCIVLAAQGYAVEVYGQLPWLRGARVRYWGDLDTHGLAILNRLRHHVPHAASVLMDSDTLLAHRPLWAHEEKPQSAPLPMLTESERRAYEFLLANPNTRLEQERLPWAAVEAAFARAQLDEDTGDDAR